MARTIALTNQKGGVGKTTTAVNLGAALAERGRRVLVVDADPQSNATKGLGVDPYEQRHTTYDVLLNPEAGAGIAILATAFGLDLLPSTIDMAAAEYELVGQVARESRLREALAAVGDRYDYILIDPPPSLGLFTMNALAAADEVLVPLQVETYALSGLAQLQRTLKLMSKVNRKLSADSFRVLCTMVRKNVNLSREVEGAAREAFGARVYHTTIPENIKLAEAPAAGRPITHYDPACAGTLAYRALAEEVEHG
jgi:chromosome partitioning protein